MVGPFHRDASHGVPHSGSMHLAGCGLRSELKALPCGSRGDVMTLNDNQFTIDQSVFMPSK